MANTGALAAARRRRQEEASLISTQKEGMTMKLTRDLFFSYGMVYKLDTPQSKLARLYELYQKNFLALDEYELKKAEFT